MKVDRYEKLPHEDFDAIVTGELAHFAIWLENALIDIISDFFAQPTRKLQFKRLLLRREGLTFQDKIDIVRAMIPEFRNPAAAQELKQILNKIESFKADRNAFAHGLDVTPESSKGARIHVEIVTRAGKERTVEVTPESHVRNLKAVEQLLQSLISISKKLDLESVISTPLPTPQVTP
jgi:hypothetical protein